MALENLHGLIVQHHILPQNEGPEIVPTEGEELLHGCRVKTHEMLILLLLLKEKLFGRKELNFGETHRSD